MTVKQLKQVLEEKGLKGKNLKKQELIELIQSNSEIEVSKVEISELPVDELQVDEVQVDKVQVDEVQVDEVQVDELNQSSEIQELVEENIEPKNKENVELTISNINDIE